MSAFISVLQRIARMDSWGSTLTGLGTDRDKATTLRARRRATKVDAELDNMFDFDDMSARLASAKPKAMFSRGFEVKIAKNTEQAEAVKKKLRKLGVVKAFVEALTKENTHGGAAILVGALDSQALEKPLDRERIRDVAYLTVLDRRSLQARAWYDDPLQPNFGKPIIYEMLANERTNGGVTTSEKILVHESRLIVFEGLMCSNTLRQQRNGWGQSLLDRSHDALQTFASNWLSIRHLLTDASQGIWTIPGVWSKILAGQKDKLMDRFEVADMAKSIVRSIILDENEKYERLNPNLSGYADVLGITGQRLAAAGELPLTVLMGVSPAGLNATGESDIRNWYDSIAQDRTMHVEPHIVDLLTLIFLSKAGPTGGQIPEAWKLHWPPLWQASGKEKAETYSLNAAADCAYVNAGVYTTTEIAFNRQTEDGYQEELSFDARAETEANMPDATPIEGADPNAPPAAPDTASVQAQALNGSQIASLKDIVTDVATKVYPVETGVELILVAFPTLTREQATRILAPIQPQAPAPTNGPTGQPTT